MRGHITRFRKKNEIYDFLPLGMPGSRVFWGVNYGKCEKQKNSF